MTATENIANAIEQSLGTDAARGPLLAKLRSMALPTRNDEDYLYTDIAAALDIRSIPAMTDAPSSKASRFAIKNGRLAAVADTAQATALPPQTDAAPDAPATTIVNMAAATQCTRIAVPDGSQTTDPIVIDIETDAPAGTMAATQLGIAVGKNARAQIIINIVGNESAAVANVLVDIDIADNANARIALAQAQPTATRLITNTALRLASGATAEMSTVNLNPAFARNDLRVSLLGEGADIRLNGLYIVAGTGHVDNCTTVDHAVAHCTSDELYKGIVGGEAVAAFAGKIIVEPDAQKTSAQQTNRHMLMSDAAHAYAKPHLEIYADDVKCSHGATTGRADDEQLFYMQARGIDIETAQQLLVAAFANEVVGRIGIEAVQQQLSEAINKQQ